MLDAAYDGMVPLLTCTALYSGVSARIELTADFDAGSDGLFSTDTDNRIYSLLRKRGSTDGTVESVRYGAKYFGQNGDTCILFRERDYPSGGTSRIVTRYFCRTGNDPLDHQQNLLLSCRQTVDYRSGDVQNAELTVTPTVVVAAGNVPVQGSLTAAIDFGKGLSGKIDAVVNYVDGTVTGTYAQAGTEYSLLYRWHDNTLELLPLQ